VNAGEGELKKKNNKTKQEVSFSSLPAEAAAVAPFKRTSAQDSIVCVEEIN
jgi:hypothetical protein